MERKGNKPSSSDDFSEGSVPQTWEERRIVSASELFEKLNQIPQLRPEAQRELTGSEFLEFLKRQEREGCRPEAQREMTGSEFLEFLKRQEPEGCRSSKEVNSGQGSIGKQRNQNYQTVAIDQCDITSSVDYGSRDYYCPSTIDQCDINSSVDYGSRDYYCPSTNSADVAYTPKENEVDDLYKNCTDTRGNWWHGSFYY